MRKYPFLAGVILILLLQQALPRQSPGRLRFKG